MKKLQMKKLVGTFLFTCVCAALASADSPHAPFNDPADVAAIKQVGQEMGDAMVADDIDKLKQIFAEDWVSLGSSGKTLTREGFFSDLKSGKHRLAAFELGPIDVQVFGDVAVAQGSVKEKRTDDGKDTSGEFVYMDLLRKREGKWAVERSAGARVVADAPKA